MRIKNTPRSIDQGVQYVCELRQQKFYYKK